MPHFYDSRVKQVILGAELLNGLALSVSQGWVSKSWWLLARRVL